MLSIKHYLQNEASSHHKKRFSGDFLDSPPLPQSPLSVHTAPWRSRMKNRFRKDREEEEKRTTTRAFSFFHFTKEHISGHHHYQLNDFRCLELAGVLNFVCFTYLWIIYWSCFSVCLRKRSWMRATAKRGAQSVSWVAKGLKIINWIARNVC